MCSVCCGVLPRAIVERISVAVKAPENKEAIVIASNEGDVSQTK